MRKIVINPEMKKKVKFLMNNINLIENNKEMQEIKDTIKILEKSVKEEDTYLLKRKLIKEKKRKNKKIIKKQKQKMRKK